uniref:ATP synthase F0 subunit 8 n=1 Tax=Acanthochitona avicula TaxID=1503212 RepID=A0A6H1PGY0_9MOLL|nr:ATP synthase F0 subunit 8 [Acanthochitona avicula]QIZ12675.1 ATP synthase F0 subunit 8 [Acanthochitona avicula]
MPQLAPLNWVMLFFLFWGSVMFIFVFVWWANNKSYYFFSVSDKSTGKLKKWCW